MKLVNQRISHVLHSQDWWGPGQLAQHISSNIQKITQCSVEIQRTLNQLGTPQDSPELRQQLQQKQQYTNQLAKETDKYIKEFGSLPTTPSEQVSSFKTHG
jgi:uncharacterized protein YwgA